MTPSSEELAIINSICRNCNTNIHAVRSGNAIDLQIIAARNGIIAFLCDNGRDDVEINEFTQASIDYIKNVLVHYKISKMAQRSRNVKA